MGLLRDHASVMDLVSDRILTGRYRALKPDDSLVDPVVVTCRIGLGVFATDRSLNQALVALIRHHVADHFGFNHASVTALSIMCR